ncbi:universal stress protein [Psychroserpens sp. SPM9]|uniref:universal stress protein n=1 Tax=Psychroserpens sp. SPM9 TaxID=2975598 RepID=UPI0021A73B01|nr:universal stress protein [Psychroserpens sp. SPM9]MDG5491191.1 universal stress protein [Psychroserpens sp. SPM9]
MKKILIPTDFSLNSYQTIDYIIQLFANECCEFYFLNSYNYTVSGLNAIEMLHADDDWFDKPKNESIEQLGKLIERYTLKSKNSKHEFNAISEQHNLVDSIKKTIKSIPIDLMVLTGKTEKTVGKHTESILKKIRCCPILIVPPHASASKGIYLTIASDFKRKINTLEIDRFVKVLENTKVDVGILVLEEQNTLADESKNNLEALISALKLTLSQDIDLEYIQPTFRLKDYARSHHDGIMCIIDNKPDWLRQLGLYKSKAISILEKLRTNTVLTVHQ